MKSFEMVTGPKRDKWLVNTVGVLVIGSAIIFLLSSRKVNPPEEIIYLAILNAAALAMIDVYYVVKKVIRPVYLADAVVEIGIIAAYLVVK
jgi:hypothetical protein